MRKKEIAGYTLTIIFVLMIVAAWAYVMSNSLENSARWFREFLTLNGIKMP